MEVVFGELRRAVTPGGALVFGRSADDGELQVCDATDATVSRRAGRIEFDTFAWRVSNIGRRSFYVVQVGSEMELHPPGVGLDSLHVLEDGAWIRVPTSGGDVAVVLSIPATERPDGPAPVASGDSVGRTVLEREVTLTDNELRSVVAIYEGYLRLPPFYRREPNSFRAAANRLGVQEGKVKADLRRVQEKVTRAGGPVEGGSRYRDALVQWLMARGVVTRDNAEMLDQ